MNTTTITREIPRTPAGRDLIHRLRGADRLWKDDVARRIGLDLIRDFLVRVEQEAAGERR